MPKSFSFSTFWGKHTFLEHFIVETKTTLKLICSEQEMCDVEKSQNLTSSQSAFAVETTERHPREKGDEDKTLKTVEFFSRLSRTSHSRKILTLFFLLLLNFPQISSSSSPPERCTTERRENIHFSFKNIHFFRYFWGKRKNLLTELGVECTLCKF